MLNIKQEIADIKRLKQILNVFIKYEFGFLVHKIKLGHLVRKKPKKENPNPERLRQAFEELGGSFIKFGQMLSLRPDLISAEYAKEFGKLRDKAKPFSTQQAREIIEEEFGDIDSVFSYFGKEPIASASIGQVYEANLVTGEKVAVKVRRPGVNKLFHSDIHILFFLAKLIKKHIPMDYVDPVEIVREFQKFTIKELDYMREAKNIELFYENFKNDNAVQIPKVYWKYTTPDIITMSFLEGEELSTVFGSDTHDKEQICKNLVNCFLKQVFVDGFFHGDPHPANILVNKDKIGLLDFGVCRFIGEHVKENLEQMCAAIVEERYDRLPKILLKVGFVQGPINMEKFEEELVECFMQYRDTQLKYVSFSEVLEKLVMIFREYKIKFPASFTLILRSIGTIESNCLALYPEFDFLKAAQPFIEREKLERASPKYVIKKSGEYWNKLTNFLVGLPDYQEKTLLERKGTNRTIKSIDGNIKHLNSTISKISSNFVITIIIVALVIGSALVMPYSDSTLFGVPKFSLIYFLIAVMLIFYLTISNLWR